MGTKDPQSLTGPYQNRCADWWSPRDSETTADDQAAGDPSTEAQHPEDTEEGPEVHPSLSLLTPLDIPASLKIYRHSFSLG